ncbi:MAG: peptide chain release factor N(5)-glutamine methyltransferase [Bacteroidota bacterium]
MTLNDFKKIFQKELFGFYQKKEIDSFFYLLTENFLNLKRIDIALDPDKEISKKIEEIYISAIAKLKKEIPIQYIIGETEFYGLKFMVDENVLIPRPETEEMVEWIITEVRRKKKEERDISRKSKVESPDSKLKTQNSKLKILDIGTGSGCIAISLARNIPNAEVNAIDISKKALNIAKDNAKLNQVNINYIEKDILKTPDLYTKFDIIVSNPPYVRKFEKKQMQGNVLKHEPHLALFVEDDDPLHFYNKIADLALKNLNTGGKLFFEINQEFGEETIELLKEKGFKDIELRKDIFGVDRMIMGVLV